MRNCIVIFLILTSCLFAQREIENGATDVITSFSMRDQTAGTLDTGVVVANLEMYYQEEKTAESADVFVGAHGAITDAFTAGECFHIGHGNYRVDWPDAAFDGGIGTRVNLILVDGDGGAFSEIMEIELVAPKQTGDSFARIGANGAGLTTLATDVALATAQTDLDTITGAAGALIDDGTGAGQLSLLNGEIYLADDDQIINSLTIDRAAGTPLTIISADSEAVSITASGGHGISITSDDDNGVNIVVQDGTGVLITSVDGDGVSIAGGTNGDGLVAAGAGSGVDIRGDITGLLTGTVAGKTPSEAGDAMDLVADAVDATSIADGGITDAKVANDVKVDVVTAESTDYTDYIETRTLATAAYFLFGSDEVANVATVGTVTDDTAQTGDSYGLLTTNLTDLTTVPGSAVLPMEAINRLYRALVFSQYTVEDDTWTFFRQDESTPVYKKVLSDVAGTTTIGEAEAP